MKRYGAKVMTNFVNVTDVQQRIQQGAISALGMQLFFFFLLGREGGNKQLFS